MAAIAQLKAVLGMDTGNYKAGMRDARGKAKSFQNDLAGIGRTMAAAFSVGAIVAATKNVISFASEIRHAADNLEVSTLSLQSLNAAGLKYGVTNEMMAKSLGAIGKSQGEVIQGSREYLDELAALNISQEEFARANKAEALELIAKGYATATNRAAAFSAVTVLAGRAGKTMTAFMKELADVGLKGVEQAAIDAGHAIKDELLTKLELLGTRGDQIMLRLKVGFAQFIDKVGGTMMTVGAMGGSAVGDILEGRIKGIVDRAVSAGADALNAGMPELNPEDGLVTPAEAQDRPLRTDAEKKAQEKRDKAIAAARKHNAELRAAMLQGLEKIVTDHALAQEDLAERRKTAQADGNRFLVRQLDIQRDILKKGYRAQVAEFEASEAKKTQVAHDAARERASRREEREQSVSDNLADTMAGLQQQKRDLDPLSRGIARSQIETMGGFVGPRRGGVGIADRQLKLKIESNRIDKEILAAQKEARDDIREIRDKVTGGAV